MAMVIAYSGFLFLSSMIWAEGISQPVHLGILTEPVSKRSFTLVQVPPVPRLGVEKACTVSIFAHLNSRAMQLHLVTEANHTEYSHVTAWVDLDRALTRHDLLVYINCSVLTDDVTDSNSTELLCLSVYVKTGGDVTYQAENCSLPYYYKCSKGNGSSKDGKTWFEARHQCEQDNDELESPSAAIWSSQDDATVNKTYWVAAASVDTIEAYRAWQPGQVTPSYNCVLLNLTTGNWTAVSCDQTNNFVLCEVRTLTVHNVTSGKLVSSLLVDSTRASVFSSSNSQTTANYVEESTRSPVVPSAKTSELLVDSTTASVISSSNSPTTAISVENSTLSSVLPSVLYAVIGTLVAVVILLVTVYTVIIITLYRRLLTYRDGNEATTPPTPAEDTSAYESINTSSNVPSTYEQLRNQRDRDDEGYEIPSITPVHLNA